MNNNALKLTAAFLQSKGFNFDIDDEKDLIITGVGGLKNKGSIRIYVIFDKDEHAAAIRSFDYVTFPEEKKDKIYEVCSQMNDCYRWAKFYVANDGKSVTVADDAVITLDNCGEEIFELILRMASIADGAYPEFMKAMWA